MRVQPGKVSAENVQRTETTVKTSSQRPEKAEEVGPGRIGEGGECPSRGRRLASVRPDGTSKLRRPAVMEEPTPVPETP